MIAELELVLQISIEELTIYGDSELIVKELRREYVVRKVSLVPYRADYLMSPFWRVNIFQVRRGVKAQADSLASLAASLIPPSEKTVTITVREPRQSQIDRL